MSYTRLFIWVEGSDDDRFFNTIIKPMLENRYDHIAIVQYAEECPKWRNNFLKSIKAMNADYIFVGDINSAPCVTEKKNIIQTKHSSIDLRRIQVTVKEIESWYLAGLDDTRCGELKIAIFNNTDALTKEEFYNKMPKRFSSHIDFMCEVLKVFSIDTAKQKNVSFCYFQKNFVPDNDLCI